MERILLETEGARHTFVLVHGPLLPYDGENCRWFFHGGGSEADTLARRHFRELFARREVICLCGHTHNTELADWYGDGGRITQMTLNSVWSKDELGSYTVFAEGPDQYGAYRKSLSTNPDGTMRTKTDGKPYTDESPLFDEYRPGLKRYVCSPSAGSYKMTVGPRRITIDFYAGDSTRLSQRFVLR